MSGRRQKNQPEQGELAFPAESRSDAPKAAEKGTETLVAKRQTESLAGTERLMVTPDLKAILSPSIRISDAKSFGACWEIFRGSTSLTLRDS